VTGIGANVVVEVLVDVDVVDVLVVVDVGAPVVEVDVEVLVVDVVIPAMLITNVLVQAPVDVTNILAAPSGETVIDFPAINSLLVAVLGVTVCPLFEVRLKLGPKLAPIPESSVNNISIYS
jgi:hypothetical protein